MTKDDKQKYTIITIVILFIVAIIIISVMTSKEVTYKSPKQRASDNMIKENSDKDKGSFSGAFNIFLSN